MKVIDQKEIVQDKKTEFVKIEDFVEDFKIINDIGTVTDKRVRLISGNNCVDIFLKDIKSIMFKHEKYRGIIKIVCWFALIFAFGFITSFSYFTEDEQILLMFIPVFFIVTLLEKYKGYYILQIKIKNGNIRKVKIRRSDRDEGIVFFRALKNSFKKYVISENKQGAHKMIVRIEKQFLN